MTNKLKSFMFLKAGPCDGAPGHLFSKIVRYSQAFENPFLKKKKKKKSNNRYGNILYTCKDNMSPFWMQIRRQFHTAIVN